MFAGRKFGVLLQMLGTKRDADGVFFRKPFAEIHQLATMRTKGAVFVGKPIAGLAACRAFDLGKSTHNRSKLATHFESHGFKICRHADSGGAFHGANFEDGLGVFDDLVELRRRKSFGVHHAFDVLG